MKQPTIYTGVKLPTDLRRKLMRSAAKNNRTLSQEIRHIVLRYFEAGK